DRGYIMTNHHVVEGAKEIVLRLANGGNYKGETIGLDPSSDLAVLKITGKTFDKKGLKALTFCNERSVGVGELVVALGAPFGLETSVSLGMVAGVERGSLGISELGNYIQTDAAIN